MQGTPVNLDSLRSILEKPPFARANSPTHRFSFSTIGFRDLQSRPDVQEPITFWRTDLDRARGNCTVLTDSTFSFAYITYGME